MTFTDAQFMSAEDKRLTLKAWKSFLNGKFSGKRFSKRLYNHLIQHCSFIAHYNRGGFWNHYFSRGRETWGLRFINQFNRATNPTHDSVEYGSISAWATNPDYSDINQAMIDVMTEEADELTVFVKAMLHNRISSEVKELERQKEAVLNSL